jgi:hypothetical protein
MSRNIQVRIEQDQDPIAPWDCDGQWTFKSFLDRDDDRFEYMSVSYSEPLGKVVATRPSRAIVSPANIGLRRKFAVGLAYWLSVYRHSGEHWFISSERPWFADKWDTSVYAGILIWEHKPEDMGAKTKEDRQKDAQGYLDQLNQYFNGEVYGVTVKETDYPGEVYESCWGFYSKEEVIDFVLDCVKPGDNILKVTGDCARLLDAEEIIVAMEKKEEVAV